MDVYWSLRIQKRNKALASSVPGPSRGLKESFMKKKPREQRRRDDLRPEYDFGSMKGGVRGKYYEQYRKESNVVVLQPDVSEAFPSEDAVNEALRGILRTTRAVRQSGGLPDRALKPASSGSKRRRR